LFSSTPFLIHTIPLSSLRARTFSTMLCCNRGARRRCSCSRATNSTLARRSSWWRWWSGLNDACWYQPGMASTGCMRHRGSRPARSNVLRERASRRHGLHQPAFLSCRIGMPRSDYRRPTVNNIWGCRLRHASSLVLQACVIAAYSRACPCLLLMGAAMESTMDGIFTRL
jgi:hypothetical protein